MIELLVIDACALLMAPELQARLLLAEASKDGLTVLCYSELPRENLRRALRCRGLLEYFDSLIYEELLSELTSSELRLLAAKTTLWLRLPEDVDYRRVLTVLPPRKRLLPRALRLSPLAPDTTFDAADDYPSTESNEADYQD